MPQSPLETAGAQVEPTSAAPLHTNEFFTGMWTQGNPLGPGAVPFLYQKFYSASRYDRMVGGRNIEVTSRLTLGRRPGNSVYNPGPFPPINRFYEFRAFQGQDEQIHLMASCDPASGSTQGSVREVTAGKNLVIWNKNPAAQRTGFQAVGNVLYFGDGVDTNKWIQSGQAWTPATTYATGAFVVDSNNNIQESMGSQTANITNIQVDVTSGPSGSPPHLTYFYSVKLFIDPGTPLNIKPNVQLTLAGLTTAPWLNGTYPVTPQSSTQVNFVVASGIGPPNPAVPYSPETGTATTGTGISGGALPAWATTTGGVTQDNTLQWVNLGNSMQAWGGDGPTTAPSVTQTAAPTIYQSWAASTWYAPPKGFVILDTNSNLQELTTAGTTGGAAPAWNTATGATTADNTAVWTNRGHAFWANGTAYALNAMVQAIYTYHITVPQTTYQWNGYTYIPVVTLVSQPVTVTSLFRCVQAGTSGNVEPSWTNGIATTTTDNTVIWANVGNAPAWPGAGQVLSLQTKIVDANGNLETPQLLGETGPGPHPTWSTSQGGTTGDNVQRWLNGGPYSAGNQYAWIWAYSGKNSLTGHISTASPLSAPLIVTAGNLPVIQGSGLADPQWDTIVLWRTVQNGSLLLYDDEFPNPGAGKTWIYTDTNQDPSSTTAPQAGQLNFLITAPINSSNNRPPAGFIPRAYYLNRIFGYVANRLVWSNGPDTNTGNGNESFDPLNQATFPSTGITCWATSIGLICYTRSDIWVMLGQGTATSPFYVVNFQQGIGLASADAFDVNGSTSYGMLTSGQVVSMDPGAGEIEVGFPIGDQFDDLYTGANTYCAWHQGSSADMALYVADGAQGWFRMAPVAAPESGNVWSNRTVIEGGVKAIASLEIAPGVRRLLLGPAAAAGGPILMRDKNTRQDNTATFAAEAEIASIAMAQPGTQVGVQFITTEEMAIDGASAISVAVLFDEINSNFLPLRNVTNDPPNLEPSESIVALRHWTSQDAGTIPICRHMKLNFLWPAENHANELLTYTIYGRLPQKARK